MPTPITKVSGSTFIQLDGTNFTTIGVDNSYKVGNGSLGAYAGLGMTFDGKPTSGIFDVKGSMSYGDNPFSGGFRVRSNIGENSQSVQFRVQPCTINIPLGNNTKAYATPYAASKVNCNTGEVTNNIGCFAGLLYYFGDGNIFVQVQGYDLTKINKNTTSVNVGFSIKI